MESIYWRWTKFFGILLKSGYVETEIAFPEGILNFLLK
jgi:hypothetical protein